MRSPMSGAGPLGNPGLLPDPQPLNRPIMNRVPPSVPMGANPGALGRSFNPVANPEAPTDAGPMGVSPGRMVM